MAVLNFCFLTAIVGQSGIGITLLLSEHFFLGSGYLLSAQLWRRRNPCYAYWGDISENNMFFRTKLCLQSPLKDNSNKK